MRAAGPPLPDFSAFAWFREPRDTASTARRESPSPDAPRSSRPHRLSGIRSIVWLPARRSFCRRLPRSCSGEVECDRVSDPILYRGIVADGAFVQSAISLDKPRLSDDAPAERPRNRRGQSIRAIAHRIHGLPSSRRTDQESSLREREIREVPQHRAVRRSLHRKSHRRGAERLCLACMTLFALRRRQLAALNNCAANRSASGITGLSHPAARPAHRRSTYERGPVRDRRPLCAATCNRRSRA